MPKQRISLEGIANALKTIRVQMNTSEYKELYRNPQQHISKRTHVPCTCKHHFSKSDYCDILLTNQFISALITRVWTLEASSKKTADHLVPILPTSPLAVEGGARFWQRNSDAVAAAARKITDASSASKRC